MKIMRIYSISVFFAIRLLFNCVSIIKNVFVNSLFPLYPLWKVSVNFVLHDNIHLLSGFQGVVSALFDYESQVRASSHHPNDLCIVIFVIIEVLDGGFVDAYDDFEGVGNKMDSKLGI